MLPEMQADAPVALGGRERPLEVAQVVLEVEGARELLGAHVDEASGVLDAQIARPADEGRELYLALGR